MCGGHPNAPKPAIASSPCPGLSSGCGPFSGLARLPRGSVRAAPSGPLSALFEAPGLLAVDRLVAPSGARASRNERRGGSRSWLATWARWSSPDRSQRVDHEPGLVPLHDPLEVEVFMSGHNEESATPAPDMHVVAKRAGNELAAFDLRAFADEPHGAARRPEGIGILRRSKALLVLSFPVDPAGVRHSRFIGTGQAVLSVGRRFRTGGLQ